MHIWPSNHSHLQFTKPFVGSLQIVPSGPFKTAPPSSVKNSLIIQESQDLSEEDAPVSLPIVTMSVARWGTAGATPSQARNCPVNETCLPEVRAHHNLGKDDDDDDDDDSIRRERDTKRNQKEHLTGTLIALRYVPLALKPFLSFSLTYSNAL